MNLKKILGYFINMSRSERNGVIVLLVLIILIAVFRLFIADLFVDKTDYSEVINSKIAKLEELSKNSEVDNEGYYKQPSTAGSNSNRVKTELFRFDPNTASYNDLVKLGFTGREANTLINYREKGGVFYRAEDLLKLYTIDKEHYKIIAPYVEIIAKTNNTNPIQIEDKKYSEPINEQIVEINNADSVLFTELKGIGPVLSSRICKYRKMLGGFYSIDQIKEVYKFPVETFEQIKNQLTVDTTNIVKLRANFSSYNELKKHPYLGNDLARKLIDYRSRKGNITNLKQLVSDSVFTTLEYEKMHWYLTVN